MKKSDLKKILKPLIKECIKEAIFEEGVLSGLIKEVISATSANNQIVESSKPAIPPTSKNAPTFNISRDKKQQISEARKKMLSAIGGDAYNGVDLFEGTTPALDAPAPRSTQPSSTTPSSAHSPLRDIDPNDAGIDISNLTNLLGESWKKSMKGKKNGT